MFGKKEEKKETITINPDNLAMDKPQEQITEQQTAVQEVTIADVIANHEARLQAIESALFRIKGAI